MRGRGKADVFLLFKPRRRFCHLIPAREEKGSMKKRI